jgi:hypothetical protein
MARLTSMSGARLLGAGLAGVGAVLALQGADDSFPQRRLLAFAAQGTAS